ncbi:MAG: archease [Candidatus Woesearchaeota archaeon]|nr:MAG: archease [Candidatus Woesearchaeota archaeon]
MVYKYFEHQADVGIIGVGKTLEESFQEAARAMFQIMASLNSIEGKKSVSISVKSEDLEGLFIEWLNELIAQVGLKNMLFSRFDIKIEKKQDKYILKGKAYGEKINSEKHKLKTEVKAASYSQLKVKKENNKYTARCVVDV